MINNAIRDGYSFGETIVDGAIGTVCGLVGGSGASNGNSKSAMTLGKQLTKRIIKTGEWRKSLAYYAKNMMNRAGNSIYKDLGKSFIYTGFLGAGLNFSKTILGDAYD